MFDERVIDVIRQEIGQITAEKISSESVALSQVAAFGAIEPGAEAR